MAYRKLGANWTPKMRQDIDSMFYELYQEYTGAGLDAKDARQKAHDALMKSDEALALSERTQKELSQAILEGDSSPLGGQLSVGSDGTVYDNPQERFVNEMNSVNQHLEQTTEDVDGRGINIIKYKHLVPNVNALSNLSQGDWTEALQQALDDSPNKGRTIFIPIKIKITNTIIPPLVSNSQRELKPITIEGASEARTSGVLNGFHEGVSVIEYDGEGKLFDLRGGSDLETNSSITFKNVSLHGKNKDGSTAIHGYDVRGANFDNVLIRNFDIGFRAKDLYYSSFNNLRCFYNKSYNAYIDGYINGTQFNKSSFSNSAGTGFYCAYAGVDVHFNSCWFESNGTGFQGVETEQIAFNNCYFENNRTTIQATSHTISGSSQVQFIGGSITVNSSADYGFRATGQVNFSLLGTRVNWQLPRSTAFISTYSSSRTGTPSIITINTTFRNKPTSLISSGTVIAEIENDGIRMGTVSFKANQGLSFANGDNTTNADIANFPELNTAAGNVRMFRNTNTAGGLTFDIHRGDGTAAYSHRFNAKTGDLFMRGGLGIGNSVVGDITANEKSRYAEVYDAFGNSLGYIQIYKK